MLFPGPERAAGAACPGRGHDGKDAPLRSAPLRSNQGLPAPPRLDQRATQAAPPPRPREVGRGDPAVLRVLQSNHAAGSTPTTSNEAAGLTLHRGAFALPAPPRPGP